MIRLEVVGSRLQLNRGQRSPERRTSLAQLDKKTSHTKLSPSVKKPKPKSLEPQDLEPRTPKGTLLNRQEAWDLMSDWTEGDSLRKHMLAVEAAMRAYARKFGEDEEKWGVTGLLHDIEGHADYLDTPRDTPMSKTLYAVDELSGFIVACALMRPERLEGMKA